MSGLAQTVEDYLSVRRSLGFKLEIHGRLLADFVAHLDHAGLHSITTDAALTWATKPKTATSIWWTQRLGVVRGFARYLQAFDPNTEVPPADLLVGRRQRGEPHLYSDEEVAALMAEARALPSPLKAATYETVIGLVAVAGLRPGEAIRLDRDDIDWVMAC